MNQNDFDKSLRKLIHGSSLDVTFMMKWFEEALNQLSSISKQHSRISHPRYRGDAREDGFSDILRRVLPTSVGISNGFAINEFATKSQEQDCLLLDNRRTATFVSTNKATYYPIESVLGSVEIKSKLNLSELRKIILNCVSLKKLAYQFGLSEDDFKESPKVRLGYFVFAYESEWSLENTCTKLNKLLETVPAALRPNMCYILKKGFLLPMGENGFSNGPPQMFTGDKFGFINKILVPNFSESDAPPFLWYISNIIDHCIEQIDERKAPWYGKYVFAPWHLQELTKKQQRD